MRRRSLLAGGISLALFADAVSAATAEDEVLATLEALVAAMNALDEAAFASFLAEDVSSFYPGEPHSTLRVQGRPAVMAEFGKLFARVRAGSGRLQVAPRDLQIRVLGSAALATFHLGPADRAGRRTMVLHRQEGRWRIVHIHASTQPPPKPGA